MIDFILAFVCPFLALVAVVFLFWSAVIEPKRLHPYDRTPLHKRLWTWIKQVLDLLFSF